MWRARALKSMSASASPLLPALAKHSRFSRTLSPAPGGGRRYFGTPYPRSALPSPSPSFHSCGFRLASASTSSGLQKKGRRILEGLPSVSCRLRVVSCTAFRAFCSVSSGQELEWREQQQVGSCSEVDGYTDHLLEVQQEKQSRFIPVKAYFISTSIDLRGLQAQNAFNVIPPTSRATNYVALRYYDANNAPHDLPGSLVNESNCSYMVVFQYGSIVLFNVADHEVDGYLKIVERHASGLLPEMRKDDYAVVEKPTLETWMQGGLDYIMLKNLNIDGIRTIGSVLGQSIALDYYIRQVDGMVAEFTDINRGMEKTGTFTMKRKKLFQLVGKANSNLADVILKLGLFERCGFPLHLEI
uniref:Sporulation protein RMD1 n=1 Tax=Anthurium amnicola TaxID=1678845 RepID=A0A1D1YZR4_9ARAE